MKLGDGPVRPPQDSGSKNPSDLPQSESAATSNAFPDLASYKEAPAGSGQTGEGRSEKPKINLLQSSKERLRRRLKDKVLKSCLVPVCLCYGEQV